MRNSSHFLFSLLLAFLFSCSNQEEKANVLFTFLPSSETNIHFSNQLTEDENFNMIEYLYFNNGAGVAAGDINNDGLTDLYFTSNQQSNKLYLNKGNFQFEDITNEAGVAGTGNWTTGVTMADVNGDNLLDIYVCSVGNYKKFQGRNQLFINQGNLKFEEQSEKYGLDFEGYSTQAAFFDYDLDGDLDMYLLNHSVHTTRSYGMANLRLENDDRAGDRLFKNETVNGEICFRDVTHEAGIYSSHIGYGLGVSISDINNDGFPDIFVSNDFHENDYLYINNSDGTFTEQFKNIFASTSRSSMGNDVGDFNNDGLPDVIVLDMLPDKEEIRKQSGGEDDYELFQIKLNHGFQHQFVRNTLQLNLGNGIFSEIGRLAGIHSTDWSWSPLFCDVDNDGWKDLFITSGIYRRANDLDYVDFLTGGNRYFPESDNSDVPDKTLYEKMPLSPNINYLYRNNRDLTFSNMSTEWGFDSRSFSNGSAYADLDNDGDLDLIVNNINEAASVYRNNTETLLDNHFITLKMKGNELNKHAVGAKILIYSKGRKQMGEVFTTRGFMSSSTDLLHFGMGDNDMIDSLIVRWPNLTEEIRINVPVDTIITLEMTGAGEPANLNNRVIRKINLFEPVNLPGLEFQHEEDNYSDFETQHLIPESLSAEGPALALGDINGDGLDDIFVGGAKGQPAAIFTQQENGSFNLLNLPLLERDRFSEDVDAVFFDADGDNDLDLYIIRGGNELHLGDPFLADRLLINDGKGNFELCQANALPFMAYNGSCVRPADFDDDGDLDLFVGSRSVPGGYGLSPNQFLLENNGKGIFKDVTNKRMKGNDNPGMVTDAVWTDYDCDNDLDLILVGEWMKVHIFQNEGGYFSDVSDDVGLKETSGWWNCIEAADFDGDGDEDLIVGNLGINSLLNTSRDKSLKMYLNDFDNSGTLDQIICVYENETSYPVASLDQMTKQINGFRKKYPHYSDFAGETVTDIFGKEAIENSVLKEIILLQSCVFRNNGDGAFTTEKLPTEAQFSAIRDVLVSDFNSDGLSDLVVAGNNYAVRPSYGRYDASYGWCLLQQKQNDKLVALTPAESGMTVRGDARTIKIINVRNEPYVIAAVNNGKLQLFKMME